MSRSHVQLLVADMRGDALEHRQVGLEVDLLAAGRGAEAEAVDRSEEHTSELQSH